MPPIERPPASPGVQAQMEQPMPGGPGFGPGIAKAQEGVGKNPIQLMVETVEKILQSNTNDKFAPYAQRAIALLKVGEAQAMAGGPQSDQGGQAGSQGQGGPQAPLPPMPGQLPG